MIKFSLILSRRLIKTAFRYCHSFFYLNAKLFNTFNFRRNLSLTRKLWAFEGEGKTTAHILNKDEELGLMIDAYSEVIILSYQTGL